MLLLSHYNKRGYYQRMKALVYYGPYDVSIDDKPHPTIKHSEDVILCITSTAICGSDLHLYHGTVPGMQPGQIIGHEFMGVIEETGPEVQDVQVDDRIVVPFNVSCGPLQILLMFSQGMMLQYLEQDLLVSLQL